MKQITVVSVGDTATGVIAALAQQPGELRIVRRCPALADLLAACQSGLAQIAFVADDAGDLTATLVDRLAAVGVSVVAVAGSPAEAQRLRGIGASAVTGSVTAEALGVVVRAAVEGRRHPRQAGFSVPSPGARSVEQDPLLKFDAGAGLSPETGTSAARPAGDDQGAAPAAAGSGGTDASGSPAAGVAGSPKQRSLKRAPLKRTPRQGKAASAAASAAGPIAAVASATAASDAGGSGLAKPTVKNDVAAGNAAASGGTAAGMPGQQLRTGKPVGLRAKIASSLHPGRDTARARGRAKRPKSKNAATASGQQLPAGYAPGHVPADGGGPGTLVAVWGPIGSPGRTTLSINLAAEQAAAGRTVMLIDADSYGASVAAALGLLDEAASFAQACRAADQGALTVAQLAKTATQVVFDGGTFSLLTGLTRADRWPELRAAAVERVLGLARELAGLVIVDCGFALENDEELSYDTVAPRRNAATLTVLAQADIVYAVGNSDPIGIPRLIRGLGELHQAVPAAAVRVVVNKVRRKAVGGAPEKSLAQAWERFGPAQGISHFLPWDPDLTDKALLEGRLLLEIASDAPLRRAIRGMDCAGDQRNSDTAVTNATARVGLQG